MTMTTDRFLEIFPEFDNSEYYPCDRIQLWLTMAGQQVSSTRWATMAELGISLWTAHYLVMDKQSYDSAVANETPGLNEGTLGSVSTGSVSSTWNTATTAIAGDGHWNKTTYGTRYRELSRMFGAGGLQMSPGIIPTSATNMAGITGIWL